MKKWLIKLLIMLPYCIPYAFLTMWIDLHTTGRLIWLIMPLVFLGLLIISIKTKNIPVAILGNIVSFTISYLYANPQNAEAWGSFCKPFTWGGFVIFMSVNVLILEIIVGAIYIRHRTRQAL